MELRDRSARRVALHPSQSWQEYQCSCRTAIELKGLWRAVLAFVLGVFVYRFPHTAQVVGRQTTNASQAQRRPTVGAWRVQNLG